MREWEGRSLLKSTDPRSEPHVPGRLATAAAPWEREASTGEAQGAVNAAGVPRDSSEGAMQRSRVVRGAPVRVNASRAGAEHGRAASRLGAGATGRAQAYPPAQTGYVGRQVASGQAAPRAGGGRGCRDHTGPGAQALETPRPPGTYANPEVASRDPVRRTTRRHLAARRRGLAVRRGAEKGSDRGLGLEAWGDPLLGLPSRPRGRALTPLRPGRAWHYL